MPSLALEDDRSFFASDGITCADSMSWSAQQQVFLRGLAVLIGAVGGT
jgi:hypothetical protein